MKKILRIVYKLLLEIEYVFLNNIVCYIPLWEIRKVIYIILGMKIGKGSRIMMKTIVWMPHKIKIGQNTIINENCYLDGRGNINIGDNVTIATYSKLITGSHNIDDDSFSYVASPINISNNVAVFSDCVVLGGSKIENGCVFSAKSLIRKGIYNERGVYGGNPAKYIRRRKTSVNYEQEKLRLLFR